MSIIPVNRSKWSSRKMPRKKSEKPQIPRAGMMFLVPVLCPSSNGYRRERYNKRETKLSTQAINPAPRS
jgi:hypothetical protein